jgi:hypothetical protein
MIELMWGTIRIVGYVLQVEHVRSTL